jgi:hypothetical protein
MANSNTTGTVPHKTTRRFFLVATAAAAPVLAMPAMALAAPSDGLALTRWAEQRQVYVERLRAIHREIEAARAKLPVWAEYGYNRIDQNGQPCGAYVGWPLNPEIIPPKSGECIVRPSTYDCRRDFALAVRRSA